MMISRATVVEGPPLKVSIDDYGAMTATGAAIVAVDDMCEGLYGTLQVGMRLLVAVDTQAQRAIPLHEIVGITAENHGMNTRDA